MALYRKANRMATKTEALLRCACEAFLAGYDNEGLAWVRQAIGQHAAAEAVRADAAAALRRLDA